MDDENSKVQDKPGHNKEADTLFFLISEFFINHKLSQIETVSISQDKQIDLIMEEFHEITTSYDEINKVLEEEIKFKSNFNLGINSNSQFSSKLNKSTATVKTRYRPLITHSEEVKDGLAHRMKKQTPTKVYAKNFKKNPSINHTIAVKRDPHKNLTIEKEKKTVFHSTTAPQKQHTQGSKSTSNQHSDSINGKNSKNASQKITFKFESKRKMLNQTIKSVEISSSPKKKPKTCLDLNRILDKKHEKIVETIVLFLNRNPFRNVNKVVRVMYLTEIINVQVEKIKKLSLDATTGGNLDNILEIELIKNKIEKMEEFKRKYV